MIVFCSNLETLNTQFLRVEDVTECARIVAHDAGISDWQTCSYFHYWHGGQYSDGLSFVWSDNLSREELFPIARAYETLVREMDAEIARDELAERASDDCVVDS